MPGLKPTFVFILITITIAAFSLFTQIDVMTSGGPMGRPRRWCTRSTRPARSCAPGPGSAMSLIFFAIVRGRAHPASLTREETRPWLHTHRSATASRRQPGQRQTPERAYLPLVLFALSFTLPDAVHGLLQPQASGPDPVRPQLFRAFLPVGDISMTTTSRLRPRACRTFFATPH